jgi:hypothetical protein
MEGSKCWELCISPNVLRGKIPLDCVSPFSLAIVTPPKARSRRRAGRDWRHSNPSWAKRSRSPSPTVVGFLCDRHHRVPLPVNRIVIGNRIFGYHDAEEEGISRVSNENKYRNEMNDPGNKALRYGLRAANSSARIERGGGYLIFLICFKVSPQPHSNIHCSKPSL